MEYRNKINSIKAMKTFFTLMTSSMLTLVTCACNSEEVNTPDKDGGIFIENVAEQNTTEHCPCY